MARLLDVTRPINAKHPVNEALIGCWGQTPFSYTKGRIRDLLNRNDMTVDSGGTLNMLGPNKRCVNFSTATLTVPGNVFKRVNGVGKISIGLWIYPTAFGSYKCVFDSTNRHTSFFINTTTDGYAGFGGTANTVAFSTAFTTNEWQYVLVTYNGTTVTVYRNGISVGTCTLGNTVFTDNIVFGPNPSGGGSAYQGKQGGWRIWARTFTAKQARELYQHAKRAFEDTYNYLPEIAESATPDAFSLVCSPVSYGWSPQDVTLTFAAASAYTLTCNNASYGWSPQAVTLTFTPAASYSLSCSPASYAWTPKPAVLSIGISGYLGSPGQAFLGRFRRGGRLPVAITPTYSPDACPQVDFWRSGTTLVKSIKLPGRDNDRTIFGMDFFLGSEFTDGHYIAVITYSTFTIPSVHYRYFEVKGGDSHGQVVSVVEMRRPLGKAVIAHREDGHMTMGYNPRVE